MNYIYKLGLHIYNPKENYCQCAKHANVCRVSVLRSAISTHMLVVSHEHNCMWHIIYKLVSVSTNQNFKSPNITNYSDINMQMYTKRFPQGDS